MYFCPHLFTSEKTSQSVSHPKIAPDQARLTLEFFAGGLLEKNVFVHFCPHLFTSGKTYRSLSHPKIASGQTRLTPEFFVDEFSEKNVYLDVMSILSTPVKNIPLLVMFVRPVLTYVYHASTQSYPSQLTRTRP
jgi:hypothetical protein